MDSMTRLQEILSRHVSPDWQASNDASLPELRAKAYNDEIGDLKGYDCPHCKNKGMIAVIREEDGEDVFRQCECIPIRRNLRNVKNSGLETVLKEKTFDKFEVTTNSQYGVVIQAKRYANNPDGWFFLSGRSGCGKTHLCTAIIGKLLEQGIPCKYMLWREEAPNLKANVNNEEYAKLVQPYKQVKCLYIDDLFKGGVTQADLNLAFEILNHRYMSKDLLTVISTEKSIEDILELDEAVGGRIYEKTKAQGNCFHVAKWGNYRLGK